MKFNCEVELDWVNEDWSFEEKVKSNVASQIAQQLATENKSLASSAKDKLEEEITKFVAKIMGEFMQEEITITDRWGEIVKDGVMVKSLIRERFDNAMSIKVDENGCPSQYSGSHTLRDWLIGEAVKKEISSEFKDFSKCIKQAVKEEMDKKIKEEVADNFATLLVSLNKTKLLKS